MALTAVDLSALQPNHRRFVAEYWRHRCNATKAYVLSGYRGRGHTAEVNGCRIARRPDVAAAIVAVRDAYFHACRTT
jgi:phage terminase small subunit